MHHRSSIKSGRAFLKSRITIGLLGLTVVLSPTGFVTRSIASEQQPAQHASAPQSALQPGQVSVTGANGKYKGQVLIEAPTETVWAVLTDYANFKNFLPDIAESRIISTKGNQKIYEQVNVFRVFAFTKKARSQLAAVESYPNQVAFKVVKGDVDSLTGTWTLTSPAPGKVLVSHEVTIVPRPTDNKTLFFAVYKNTLKKTITAIHKEVERRAQ